MVEEVRMKVYVIGAGMGNADTLTVAAMRAIESCDSLVGAKRLLDAFDSLPCEKRVLVRADDIVAAVAELQASGAAHVCILMSGDVGFYSGATSLYDRLSSYDVEVIPGISSLGYFCAKLRTPWQDAKLVSAHGREHDAVGDIQSHALTFCITGGKTKVQDICQELVERGFGNLEAAAGERLSYPEERIVKGTAAELARMEFADLSVLLVWNPSPLQREFGAPALPDAAFERGPVPMTKGEVRALVVAKMRIAADHTVWDVGAGTGSVSIEAARAAYRGRVFAIEKETDAIELLERNREVHGATNLTIVPGTAPDALASLPAPDSVFIGGSGGSLSGIIQAALAANPAARICVTAVTLQTLADIVSCLQELGIEDADIVQVSVARAQHVGAYNLMKAENPVHIATFSLNPSKELS